MGRVVICSVLATAACWGLTPDELAMLQDQGGWEYLAISDANNGFQTQAVCFDKAFTGQCRGDLLFRTDSSFRQDISGNGRSMHRGGRYEVKDDQLTFWDEHETRDGPYTISLDLNEKTLHMESVQAGVKIEMSLLLESEFKKKASDKKK